MLRAEYAPGCERPFEERRILYAFHDIDGTHSLIRNWPPVMSIVLWDVIAHGLREDFDSDVNCRRLIEQAGRRALPETDRFCVESAGLSALTQMEWAIRRAAQEGTLDAPCEPESNARIVALIEAGVERYDDISESDAFGAYLAEYTPRLFRLYEKVLNGYCRDTNLAKARLEPEAFRVKGSMDFIKRLRAAGVKNYFVTGAVVEKGMGMFEEVEALGYEMGPDCAVEDIIGSTWDNKMPKDEIMRALLDKLGARGDEVLVTGDGRSEISAGVQMGALTLSRLNADAARQRELHRLLGTYMIVEDFTSPLIDRVFRWGEDGGKAGI